MSRTLSELLQSSDEGEKTPPKAETKKKLKRRTSTDSSGDSFKGSPSPGGQSPKIPQTAAQQRMKEAEERRQKQEEIRAKMKATMPADAVDKIISSSAEVAAKKITAASSSLDSASPQQQVHPPKNLPPLSSSGDHLFQRRESFNSRSPHHYTDEDPYGVMVADRGTQTVMEVECQTDPDPQLMNCSQCYAQYFGHSMPGAGCPHGMRPDYATLSAAYDARRGLGAHTSMMGPLFPSGQQQLAGNGPPVSVAAMKLQLQQVQETVETIIRKYNLPPPPSFA